MCPLGHVDGGQEAAVQAVSLELMVVWLAAQDASVVTLNKQLRLHMALAVPCLA
jgi:hypothetical protein